jgi:hypothetical protein
MNRLLLYLVIFNGLVLLPYTMGMHFVLLGHGQVLNGFPSWGASFWDVLLVVFTLTICAIDYDILKSSWDHHRSPEAGVSFSASG